MSKFAKKPKPDDKVLVGVMLDPEEIKRLESITYNKSGWCRKAILTAMDKHDYDSQGVNND